jgi:hypothetical protein
MSDTKIMDDPAVSAAIEVLKIAVVDAGKSAGMPQKSLIVISRHDGRTAISAEGCFCPVCTLEMLRAFKRVADENWSKQKCGMRSATVVH